MFSEPPLHQLFTFTIGDRTSYLKPPFDKLMDWEAPWSADKVDDLTDIGVAEITGIATRLKKVPHYPRYADAYSASSTDPR